MHTAILMKSSILQNKAYNDILLFFFFFLYQLEVIPWAPEPKLMYHDYTEKKKCVWTLPPEESTFYNASSWQILKSNEADRSDSWETQLFASTPTMDISSA